MKRTEARSPPIIYSGVLGTWLLNIQEFGSQLLNHSELEIGLSRSIYTMEVGKSTN